MLLNKQYHKKLNEKATLENTCKQQEAQITSMQEKTAENLIELSDLQLQNSVTESYYTQLINMYKISPSSSVVNGTIPSTSIITKNITTTETAAEPVVISANNQESASKTATPDMASVKRFSSDCVSGDIPFTVNVCRKTTCKYTFLSLITICSNRIRATFARMNFPIHKSIRRQAIGDVQYKRKVPWRGK